MQTIWNKLQKYNKKKPYFHLQTYHINTLYMLLILYCYKSHQFYKKTFFILLAFLLVCNTSFLFASQRDFLYTTWHNALAMDSLPKHKNASYLPYANPNAKKGGIFKTMALGSFDSLDLFVLKGNKADSLWLLYDTLMQQSLDEPYAIYPLVAEQLSLAKDGSGVRFKINKHAKFNDGTPIKAEDIKFSFDMLIQKGNPTQAKYYADVKEAIVINDSIIEFQFKTNSNKELPFILTQLHIIPKHFYLQNNQNLFGTNPLRIPLGSGPYSIESFDINKQITYKRNKSYWAKDLMVNKGAYNFDLLKVEYFKDESVALRAFLALNYDYRFEPQAKAWANDYKSNAYNEGKFKMLHLTHGLPAGMQGFFLNTRQKILQDKILREAILQAFDFEWSNQYLFYSQYKRTQSYYENSEYASKDSLIAPQNSLEVKILQSLGILELNKENHQIKITDMYKNDLDERMLTQEYRNPITTPPYSKRQNLKYAQKILQEAGYKVINNQLQDSQNTPIVLNIILSSPLFERVVLPFKKNLAILGITLNIHIIDSTQYENRLKTFDYDIIVGVIPQSLFPGNEQEFFFSSSSRNMHGSKNFAGVENKAIDLLIQALNKTSKHDERRAILHLIDRILLWNFYVVPHFYSPNFRIALKSTIQMPQYFPPYASPFEIYHYWWEQ